jgi:hypothetical protein
MAEAKPETDKQEDTSLPEWEREPVSLEEAITAVLNDVYDIEGMQRLLTVNIGHYPGLTAPSPTAMRRAFVLRYAATVLQIVHENSEEFKKMIASKRARAKRGQGG